MPKKELTTDQKLVQLESVVKAQKMYIDRVYNFLRMTEGKICGL